MIDVLSKYAVVVPIKSKTPPDIIAGTMEGLQKMGKKCKILYTDDERGIVSADLKEYVDGEGIELYRARGHPAFAERFIRTFKDTLNYLKELNLMRRTESRLYNGLTTY